MNTNVLLTISILTASCCVGCAGRLHTDRERTLSEELPRILTDVQHSMTDAHEAVADRFFRQAAAVTWSAEAVS